MIAHSFLLIRKFASRVTRRNIRFGFGLMFVALTSLPQLAFSQKQVVPTGPRPFFYFHREPAYELRQVIPVPADDQSELWVKALDHGGRDLLCECAAAVISAHSQRVFPISDPLVQAMISAFENSDDEVARRSLANALITVDAQDAAEVFSEACSDGPYRLCQVIEPALGRWQHAETLMKNRERLSNESTLLPWKKLSLEVVGAGRDSESKDALLRICMDSDQRSDLRFLAADALRATFETGLLPEAKTLWNRDTSEDKIGQLLAVQIVERHQGDELVEFFRAAALADSTSVQALALAKLQQLNPLFVTDLVLAPDNANRFTVDHRHSDVRRTVIESLYTLATEKSIPALTLYLEDLHPTNRQIAADGIFALSAQSEDLKKIAIEQVKLALQNHSWRTLEKACLLAAELKIASEQEQIEALLKYERKEVGAAAAYALKEFSLKQSLPVALAHVIENQQLAYRLNDLADLHDYKYICEQTQHLCELMGKHEFQEADKTLRLFIPKFEESGKIIHHPMTRGIAIWALGRILVDSKDDDLAKQLVTRMMDNGMPPEYAEVKEGCSYALGWIKSEAALPAIRELASRISSTRSEATGCAWALKEMTGEETEIPPPFENKASYDWFLKYTEK